MCIVKYNNDITCYWVLCVEYSETFYEQFSECYQVAFVPK